LPPAFVDHGAEVSNPMTTHGLALFVAAGLLLNITPGPDVLYIVGRAASQGRKAGFVSALGIGAGGLLHILAAVAGVSTLMMRLPAAYETVRWLGAAYLFYLGLRALFRRGPAAQAETELKKFERDGLRRVFWQGFLTNALNPKVALFFAAFLPQFVDPARGSLPLQFLLLGLVFDVNGTIVNLAYAALAGSAGSWLRGRLGGGRVLDRFAGLLFVGLGIRLALASRRP
jgi:threonine/homoserine/homoserine lactone efflux protein